MDASFLTRTLFAVGVCLVLAGVSTPANATTMPYLTLPELVQKSDLIVRGTVDGQRSFIDSQTNRITTHTTIAVDKVFYGALDRDRVRVEKWGGEVGDRGLHIPGSATYQTGEDVLLFLEFNEKSGKFPVFLVAMTQSKFHIADTDDGERISRSAAGIEYLDSEDTRGNLEQSVSFSSFESRLLSLIYTLKGGATGED